MCLFIFIDKHVHPGGYRLYKMCVSERLKNINFFLYSAVLLWLMTHSFSNIQISLSPPPPPRIVNERGLVFGYFSASTLLVWRCKLHNQTTSFFSRKLSSFGKAHNLTPKITSKAQLDPSNHWKQSVTQSCHQKTGDLKFDMPINIYSYPTKKRGGDLFY